MKLEMGSRGIEAQCHHYSSIEINIFDRHSSYYASEIYVGQLSARQDSCWIIIDLSKMVAEAICL